MVLISLRFQGIFGSKRLPLTSDPYTGAEFCSDFQNRRSISSIDLPDVIELYFSASFWNRSSEREICSMKVSS